METKQKVDALKNRISKVYYELLKINDELEYLERAYQPYPEPKSIQRAEPRIIPFPGVEHKKNAPFLAMPGYSLPSIIPDFRSSLQRDGLILLGWDRRKNDIGELFTAYWVTSIGHARYYASRQYNTDNFPQAVPDHKSYAAEDGIEFYGQEAPSYVVHTAPELMMSNPHHSSLRAAHICNLRKTGVNVDFMYKYLLTKEKYRKTGA